MNDKEKPMDISKNKHQLIVEKLNDWSSAAKYLLEYAEGKKKFVFAGEIGAGKTTFIQALCGYLNVTSSVTSPTFALVNEYQSPMVGSIFHLDLYRLKNIKEAVDIGIEEILYGPEYCFIEWPELIIPMLESDTVRIQIELMNDSRRKILFL